MEKIIAIFAQIKLEFAEFISLKEKTMFVKIYGRMTCPYCVRARDLAEKLTHELADFSYEFVDIIEQNLSKEDIAQRIGVAEVKTVPQITIDDQPIGGCTDFQALIKEKFGIEL